MRKVLHILMIGALTFILLRCGGNQTTEGKWVVTKSGDILQIAYGSGTNFPQYGALHLDSSYFRLNYGPTSGWGTSVILFPAFWSDGEYYQGAPVTDYSWQVVNQNLILSIRGTIGGLSVSSQINLSPPAESSIIAQVTTTVAGSVSLDNWSGEAFKPVMLSSMHISFTQWDTQKAFVSCQYFDIPLEGWIIQPPFVTDSIFGLVGAHQSGSLMLQLSGLNWIERCR